MSNLRDIAERELRKNIVQTQAGLLLLAGGHQFRTFWVRDFCFSVPGLLAIGEADLVQRQLEICFRFQREDGLIARGFDVVNPKFRVVCHSLGLQNLKRFSYADRALCPEYLGEHGTPAVDSNLLTLLAVTQWTSHTKNQVFYQKYAKQICKALDFVWQSQKNGLLHQPGFSDWQDSARRSGAGFYLNLLFLKVLNTLLSVSEVKHELMSKNISGLVSGSVSESILDFGFINAFRDRLWQSFFDTSKGLFVSQIDLAGVQKKQYSLETQLWCIEENLFSQQISRQLHWQNLRRSELLLPMAGRPVWPDYKDIEISWTTKVVGLRHYHDRFRWSWLIAETLKVAQIVGDVEFAHQMNSIFERLVSRDLTVCEIYEPDSDMLPVSRLFYRSERPFSWGAAKLCEALSFARPT